MDRDTRRIRQLERGFRRDGLPNLIVDQSATEDIFTRALPLLTAVFLVEVMGALGIGASLGSLLVALAVVAALIAVFGLLNLLRGHRFLSIPHRVGVPELVVFVTLPALLTVASTREILLGVVTSLVNAAVLGVAYLVAGFGLFAIVRWAFVRLFAQLAASGTVLVRAVPLLLFFSLVMFFTAEIWEVFTSTGSAAYWTAIGMFVLLGMLFLSVRLPGLLRDFQDDLDVGDVPLRRRERLNLAAIVLISESMQVLFVSAAVWLFYVILGTLLVSADVRGEWLGHPGYTVWDAGVFGERVQVTSELLRVATGVAAFAGLYYAVAILVDATYREQFLDSLTAELRGAFEHRSEYHDLLRRSPLVPLSRDDAVPS